MELRGYQNDIVLEVRKRFREGKHSPCVVLPCGGGKSVIIAEIAKRTTQTKNVVLFLVHRKELKDQIVSTFKWWGVDMNYCDVMMVQTASRKISKLRQPKLIITDESHHSKANTYTKIYDAFSNAYRLGFTATPVRLDGSGLEDVSDVLVEGMKAKWLIENKYLSPYEYYAPKVADLSDLKVVRGEFSTASVEKAMLKKAIFGDVIKHYKKLAGGKQAICYCVSIAYSQKMADEFNANGIVARHIDGKTNKQERDKVIEQFRSGDVKILCNVDLISEGFDVPDCECAILLRPTQSLTLYIQQSMRCMRYKEGKTAVIIDHVGNYSRHGMPDMDRTWSLESKKKSKEQFNGPAISVCPECFYTFIKCEPLICPDCGYVFPEEEKKQRNIGEEKEYELEKIDRSFVVTYMELEDCRNYNDLRKYAKLHGYKEGWAYYKAKERGWLKSQKNTKSKTK